MKRLFEQEMWVEIRSRLDLTLWIVGSACKFGALASLTNKRPCNCTPSLVRNKIGLARGANLA